MADELYQTYDDYKGWSGEALPVSPGTFENVVSSTEKTGRLRILEIGFGDGAFLDWARAQGHAISGTEIRDSALSAARARGHTVDRDWPGGDPLDLIVALDVFEHFSRVDFQHFFQQAEQHLAPGGLIVARFPNGSSPFFGHFQHGDFTHERAISPSSVKQLALLKGFDLIKAVNPRPVPRGMLRSFKARAAYLVRDCIEIVLGYAYFGCRVPMDPNVLVVLARSGEGAGVPRPPEG